MKIKQYFLISVTIILSLNFGRGEEIVQPGYYYILTQPIPVNYNKINPLTGQTGEICFVDVNQQQQRQQQLYEQLVPKAQPKQAISPELIVVESVKKIPEIQIPNQAIEIQHPSSQIHTQSNIDETKIINEIIDLNQTESSTDSGRIPVPTNAPVKNNSKVVDLHKVIIRNTNNNEGFDKSKKSFDILFSHEVLQQMSRDLVNNFINKVPGGVKHFNFTQYVEDVEKVIKTYLPYGILSVANGEVSNFVQNVLPQLNGQPLQNLINNPNLINNYANLNNGFNSWGTFFDYVLRNGGPGLTQTGNARNYNSLFMNNNGQPENRNYNPQFANNNNGLPDTSRNFNFPPAINNNNNNNNFPPQNNGQFQNRNFNPLGNQNFNIPHGQNFNYPSVNSGQIDGRNFNHPLLNYNNNNNNGQPENRNWNSPFMNNGQPGLRNFDSPPSINNGPSGGQNLNFPQTSNNNVQRRMVNNPSNIFKMLDKNVKFRFT